MAQKLFTSTIVTVVTAGTRVALSSVPTPVTSILIEADIGNTDNIYVGDDSVDSTNGIRLVPGESVSVGSDQIPRQDDELFLSDVFLDADTNGDKARIQFIKRR